MTREPCTSGQAAALAVSAGVVCGGVFAGLAMGWREAPLGVFFGGLGGGLIFPLVRVALQGATAGTGLVALPVALAASIAAGMMEVHPLAALFLVGYLFVLVCGVVARWDPAVRDALKCAGCGYDLRGLKGGRCPECGGGVGEVEEAGGVGEGVSGGGGG